MRYDVNGEVTTLYDSKGESFIIDTDQLEKVLQYNWYVDVRKGYVDSTSHKIKQRKLHRYLLDTDLTVDHINRNPRDNRLCNLRVCTTAENNRNKKVRSDSRTGIKGVHYEPNKAKKYRARIQLNGKRITIGRYETLEEAERAYNEKAAELFGDYVPLLSSFSKKQGEA